eukprot:gnl/TRDRNA2_/TRDRNA2_91308_c0_seq1.p1 gnl/TRDRNA2_/TRDRNA2_91308_c0~~gnl/TRDRNA2_/TRDRNA2_91308_c0_seq1.p1  ORF type:complete len:358 (-),score=32.53 gnl/TRDRNA2_/TRDRNA2_91308_c0_seq1:76-1149(-)
MQETPARKSSNTKGSSAVDLALSPVPWKESKKLLGRRASDVSATAGRIAVGVKSGDDKLHSSSKPNNITRDFRTDYFSSGDGSKVDWRRAASGPRGAGSLRRRHTYAVSNGLGVVSPDSEESPRLWAGGHSKEHGAPLLAEAAKTDQPPERFCVTGAISDCPGAGRRGGLQTPTAYPDIVARFEAGIRQASIVLSDRFSELQRKWKLCMPVTGPCSIELCEIADGLGAAAYHVQKWASLLSHSKLPIRPICCTDPSEAFATFHCSLPRFMVTSVDVSRGLCTAVAEHGPQAELHVQGLGIPTADLQALLPHLEHIAGRIHRLLPKLRPTAYRNFVLDYFGPSLSRDIAKRLLPFLGL